MLALYACGGTSGTALITPTTGIVVRAEALTTGRGCGRAPSQIFKYAVAVYPAGEAPSLDAPPRDPLTANLYDCFADGTFTNLPIVNGGFSYDLQVFAYNETSFLASGIAPDGRGLPNLRPTNPTWTTRCTATQLDNVQALATCAPLASGLGGLDNVEAGAALPSIALATESFTLNTGAVVTCARAGDGGAPSDGGDAAADASDASDAGDAGDGATPPPTGSRFTIARIRYQRGEILGPTLEIACPATYKVQVPAEPGTYVLAVGLIDDRTSPATILGETACSAVVTGKADETSSATCPSP